MSIQESVDVCVIGSGAGGAMMAHEAARRGLSTLVLEKGPYVRAAQMSHDEMDMIALLYKDGGLQLNTSMDLFIMQGTCVGGSTVLSNMVLLRAAPEVFATWRRLGADIDTNAMSASYDKVEAALEAAQPRADNVSKSSRLFKEAAERLGHEPRWMLKALGEGCVGCGDCNIGCTYDTKKSALTTHVRWAEAAGARIMPETDVVNIRTKNGRAVAVEAVQGRLKTPVTVRAKQVIVAAGAIGSSYLLLKSGIRTNVGTRLSFNAGSMIVADFPEPLDAYDADQMTMYLLGEGFIIEPTHNPLMAGAMTTPGWMSDHGRLVRRQRNLAYAGALVATESLGRVVDSLFYRHEETRYHPTPTDLARLRNGLKMITEVFFEAGATRCILPTHELRAMKDLSELHMIDDITSVKNISFGTAHPQGGNPMSDDPRLGVVNNDFAVHGFDNLFVCDASVFPSCIGVNPINTILAVCDQAAPRIFARA